MLGPIAVQGARPGHVLEVHLEAITPGEYGWTYAGEIGFFNTELNRALGVIEGEAELLRWEIDVAENVATSHTGFRVPLHPFLGTIGLCPRGTGWQSAWPPYTTGGNLDCKDLVAGSILYLPVEVDGALLSLGDGHAAQGDGESCGTAIECPMARVDLRLVLREDLDYTRIIANTPSGWITFGFDESLDVAVVQAIDGMLQLLQRMYPISRKEALGLVSVAVDVRITQLVNGVRGVHACLPHNAVTAM
jgi:acetamidase/formamidase